MVYEALLAAVRRGGDGPVIELNAALVLGLAGALSGLLMAALAFALSSAPGWNELRSFALLALLAAAYCTLSLVHVVRLPPETVLLGDRMLLAASFAYGLAMVRHLAVMDGRPLRRRERYTLVVGAALIVLALVPGVCIVAPVRAVRVEWFGVTYMLSTGTLLALAGVAFVVGAMLVAAFGGGRRWRDGWRARLPMIGTSALAVAGVTDTLGSLELIPVPQLVEGLTVAVVGTMGVWYAQRFIADARRLEALSTRLEQEVASRTEQLLRAQDKAAEYERLAGIGRVAAGVAHEINNPTAVIQQNLDRLRALLPAASELEERITRARTASQRIAEIVRQLLDTARAPAANPDDAPVFALGEAIERAIEAAGASAPELRVAVAIAPGLYARGEARLLEQVVLNLLVNAAHAARDAVGGPRAEIAAVRDGKHVRVTVKDNGPGISPAIRDRMFEPFATTKPIGQGTGLGLAVSRGHMTHLGGSLSVASSTASGTEMAVELLAADPVERPVSEPDAPPTESTRRDLRVLVIDDSAELREVMIELLETEFIVDEAPTVAAALAHVRAGRRYDAVLCDLMMPFAGGEAWLAACAKHHPELAARTLLVTGGATTPAGASVLAAHADRVLYKPFVIADVERAIRRVANR